MTRPVNDKKLAAFLKDIQVVLDKHSMSITPAKRTIPALSGPSCDIPMLKISHGKGESLVGAETLIQKNI